MNKTNNKTNETNETSKISETSKTNETNGKTAWLSRALRMNAKINADLQELDSLKQLADRIGSSAEGLRVSGSRDRDPPFVRALMKIDEAERRLEGEIDRYVALKEDIRAAIMTVKDPDEQAVLLYRYISGCGRAEIAERMHSSERTITRMISAALAEIIIPEEHIK